MLEIAKGNVLSKGWYRRDRHLLPGLLMVYLLLSCWLPGGNVSKACLLPQALLLLTREAAMIRAVTVMLFGCILCALFLGVAQAKTVSAASCSQSDVQAAINATNSGDTVAVPKGTCTWSSTVTISSSHQITMDGGGSTITFGSGGSLSITTGTASNTRVTNFNFIGSGTNGSDVIEFHTVTSPPSLTFRFDHNSCNCGSPSAPSTILGIYQNGPGLIDHNSFTCAHGADELIHVLGLGPSDNSGWWDDVTPGGPNMIFIEDNTFNDSGGAGASAFQSYYGARTVARHNTFTNAQIDQHGSGMIGARWYEFYSNNFTDAAGICIRAGSGVVFSNTNTGAIRMTQEFGSYPAEWQVGQGKEVTHNTPTNCSTGGPPGCAFAYVWSDVTPLLNTTAGCAAGLANLIQFQRDVYSTGGNGVTTGTLASRPSTCSKYQGYFATDQNTLYQCTATNTWTAYYTPYTYPHPLTQGTTVAPPSNLQATPH